MGEKQKCERREETKKGGAWQREREGKKGMVRRRSVMRQNRGKRKDWQLPGIKLKKPVCSQCSTATTNRQPPTLTILNMYWY